MMGAAMKAATKVTRQVPDLDELARRFFELLETDRESEAFLARFWELDEALEAALLAQGHAVQNDAAFGQEGGRRRAKA